MGIHHERDSHARKRIEEQLSKPIELTEEDAGSCFNCHGSGIVEDFDGDVECSHCRGTGVAK